MCVYLFEGDLFLHPPKLFVCQIINLLLQKLFVPGQIDWCHQFKLPTMTIKSKFGKELLSEGKKRASRI